jgi:hypothetical protein
VETLFKDSPLLGTKFMDCELFFSALRYYKNPSIPRHIRILYVAHCMFQMNTKGKQRARTLNYYENCLKDFFNTEEEWQAAIGETKLRVAEVLKKPFPSLNMYSGTAFDNYFCALITGDGCCHGDFKIREGRKATVYKALSISLLKTERNEALLDFLATYFNVRWNKRPAAKGRHYFSIDKQDWISDVFQPYFEKNKEKFPAFRKKQLLVWLCIDQLKELLNNGGSRSEEEKEQICSLLNTIYYIHANALYRRTPYSKVLKSFKDSWNC